MSSVLEQADLLFREIIRLYEQELYKNLIILADLLQGIIKNVQGCLDPKRHLQFLKYLANSYYNTMSFEKAAEMYETLYDTKKEYLNQNVSLAVQVNDESVPSNADIKYRMYQCLVNQNKGEEGIDILDSIPVKERTPKVNMALGEHYHYAKGFRAGVPYFLEVLKECPLALSAAELMLETGMEGVDMNSLIAVGPLAAVDWLDAWIKGYRHMHRRQFEDALQTFLTLLLPPSVLADCVTIMVALGETYYRQGNYMNAKKVFKQVLLSDPLCARALSVLATIYLDENDIAELEKVVPRDFQTWSFSPPVPGKSDLWTTAACLMYAKNKASTASAFARNACKYDSKNVEALCLKGKILCNMKKHNEGILSYGEAIRFFRNRYEPHRYITECYLHQDRFPEALNMANICVEIDNESPRSLTLQASVFLKDRSYYGRAKAALLQALKKDEHYLPAVRLLVQVYEEEGLVEAAMDLLEYHTRVNSCSEIHQRYAEILHRHCNYEKAFEHYQSALRLDSKNHKAKEGLVRLESRLLPTKETASSSGDPPLSENLVHVCSGFFGQGSCLTHSSDESSSEPSQ